MKEEVKAHFEKRFKETIYFKFKLRNVKFSKIGHMDNEIVKSLDDTKSV